jgi:two-component system, OmpR family, catabolic regulation response regulator CreB
MTQIVVVEDEMSIADALVFALESEGFSVKWVRLGTEGVAAALEPGVQLIILDVGLPDLSGFEVCKLVRKSSDVPILFLTARGEEIDRIVGLEIGADDYVVKPFSPREVATRVRVILKRVRSASRSATSANATALNVPPAASPTIEPEFVVSWDTLTLAFCGTVLPLTQQEFRLLAHLVQHPGRVFSRRLLLEAVGAGTGAGYERNIDSHVKTLRAKLREVDAAREPIQTHRGFGYSYRPGRGRE